MKVMKREALIGAICIFIGSCAYKYSVYDSSTYAPGQIPLHATVDVFEDNSLKEGIHYEEDAGLKEDFQMPLKDMVAEAIFMDLYRNGVFKSISLRREKVLPLTHGLGPLYLSGKINEFSYRGSYTWLSFISVMTVVGFLSGMPMGKVTSTVDLTIDITCVPTQKVIKEYPVRGQMSRWLGLYYNLQNSLQPLQLSEILTQAMDQFKTELIQDRDLILKECSP